MRKTFSYLLHNEMGKNKDIFILVGDVGYGMWDNIKNSYSDRFFNVGSSEITMMSIAVGLSLSGKIPIVYSITPFVLYRPFEILRTYINHEKLNVKIIGSGRNKDYENNGITHWAEDDLKIMSCLENIEIFYPENIQKIKDKFNYIIYTKRPFYINLKR
ncbi:MAG: hypothetical protein AABY32_02465 [Nanoarchaeota archaeon]